jgi:hypothetical protein
MNRLADGLRPMPGIDVEEKKPDGKTFRFEGSRSLDFRICRDA